MARIRSIKPSIWSDQRFSQLSLNARLLCIGMISNADDSGRLIASGVALLGAVFPHDGIAPRTVEKWRDEIADTGLVTVYRQGRGTYAHFPQWNRHQRIQKKQPSTLPAPPASTRPEPEQEPPEDENDYPTDSRTESRTHSDTEGERDKEKVLPPYPPPTPVAERGCDRHTRRRAGCADCDRLNRPPRPRWCGSCNPDTRRLEHPETAADSGPCPECSPALAAAQ